MKNDLTKFRQVIFFLSLYAEAADGHAFGIGLHAQGESFSKPKKSVGKFFPLALPQRPAAISAGSRWRF